MHKRPTGILYPGTVKDEKLPNFTRYAKRPASRTFLGVIDFNCYTLTNRCYLTEIQRIITLSVLLPLRVR